MLTRCFETRFLVKRIVSPIIFCLLLALINHTRRLYEGEMEFIAVLTQERALRLLDSDDSLAFDDLYTDEPRHLYESGSRMVLLSRLIRLARRRKRHVRHCYLISKLPSERGAAGSGNVFQVPFCHACSPRVNLALLAL